MTQIYRAAPAEHPHFGFKSYWTTSAEFAFRERGSTAGLDPAFAALVPVTQQYVYLNTEPIPAVLDQ